MEAVAFPFDDHTVHLYLSNTFCTGKAKSGYPPVNMPSFENYNWDLLKAETVEIMTLARDLKVWVVLGSSHLRVRASDNLMWVIANNDTTPYSSWGSRIARPDGSVESLERGVPGILYRDFPDSETTDQFPSWTHNEKMMKLPKDEVYNVRGETSKHPRMLDTTTL